jgi:hypothetical protein
MPNGRCRMHGGLSTGAPKGNQNALKHGRYEAPRIMLWIGTEEDWGGGDVPLFLLLFIITITLCACQNPGCFQAPEIDAAHLRIGAMDR